MLRLFSLGVLAAVTALLSELMAFSLFPQSLFMFAITIPLLEEGFKFGLLWKGKKLLPRKFSHDFFSATAVFGLGFALPEGILNGSAGLTTDPFGLVATVSIHLISAFFLGSSILFIMRKKWIASFALLVFSFAIHALYNFLIFIK